jgi:hypothetical protein
MMHPDHLNFIILMIKAAIAALICIYAFKLGHISYEILYSGP